VQVIHTRSQVLAPVERDNEKPEVISRLAVMAGCSSQDRKEKMEIFSISGISGVWGHGLGRELKRKDT